MNDEHDHHDDHHEHGHRMHQDGTTWQAMRTYLPRIRSFWSNDLNSAVVDLLAPAEGETLLDIGAGMGAATFDAAKRVGRKGSVIAIEPTPFMRRVLAIRRLGSRSRSRITAIDGRAEELPVGTDMVSAAWAVNVLHHLSDLDAAVLEIRRVLAPGGRVVLVDEDFDDPDHPRYEEMKARHGQKHGDHEHLMIAIDELGESFTAAGFRDVVARLDQVAEVPVRMLTANLLGPSEA